MHISDLLQDGKIIANYEIKRVEILEKYKYASSEDKILKKNTVLMFLKNGFLNRDELVFMEFESEKFCIYTVSTGKVKRLKNKGSLENLITESYGFSISLKVFSPIIPILNLTFTPNEKKIFNRGARTHFNKFIENDILATRHYIKKDDKLKELDFSKYPNIKKLLDNLFIKDDYLNYFINWLSTILNTLKKTRTAIILKGVEGAGKGILFKYLIRYIFGTDYTIEIGNNQLKSDFNSSLENRLFVVCNEIKGDMRDGNTTYEKLKAYITEDTLIIELKNIDEIELENHFNMMFFTNNSVPLQISPTDRRYSVFTTNDMDLKFLIGIENMDKFIKDIENERDDFFIDLIKYDYIEYKASLAIDTDDKQTIVDASTSKIELLGNWLKKGDIDKINSGIDDLENYTNKELAIIFDVDNISDYEKKENIDTLKSDINSAFDVAFIDNNLATILYKVFVNYTDNTRKIGIALNTVLGKSEAYKINKQSVRGRKIKLIEIPF